MARLNEPPAPVDNFDILRRKFLRQNRDIARVNSNQSLRIRGLENECARLLSENLDLRGQVLRLEKEIEDDKSQRVAGHALQIKEKMEAQLVELGALLAGFGLEPPTKRQSPVTVRRTNKPVRLSLSIESTPPQRQRPSPLSASEAESLAAQEGRLPPIYETKTFPRRTLGQDEILALQADDNKAAGSPGLGPPPVSRMLRDEMKKTNEASSKPPIGIFDKAAPTSKAKATDDSKPPAKSRPAEVEQAAKAQSVAVTATSQSLVSEKKAIASKTPAPPSAPVVSTAPMPTTTTTTVLSVSASAKSSGKRKFAVNDENAALRGLKAGNESNKPQPTTQKNQTDKTAPIRELKNPRSIRSQVSNRKEAEEDPIGAKEAAPIRQPLAAKSTNKDISTPRKQALNGKEKPKDNNNNAPSAGKPTEATGRMRNRTKMTVAADISGSSLLETVDIHLDNDKASRTALSEVQRERKQSTKPDIVHLDLDEAHLDEPEMDVASPSTPPPPSSTTLSSQRMVVIRNEGRDTPPPADISSQGEVSRPSRRSRTSVSYAEPNLRDKMRRPTKELFDAVAGEGKYVQRHSLQPPNSQDQDEDNGEHMAQPSSDKTESSDSANSHQQMANASPAAETAQRHTPTDQDPYEFTVSSSSSPQEADEESELLAGKNKTASSSKKGNAKSSSKGSRRASSVSAPQGDDASGADRHTRPSASRKRASMVAIKRGSLLDSDEEDQADSSYEPSAAESNDAHDAEGRAASTRERISRRRSMML
ncbi:shugoshin family protein [Ophiostoma piceae UAMH 11346]|uniref:Shugoshin family protein n=1 Tax=Ophiostoma piceae (strain UAMH 11346) TaxID=1262450 RepID=S3CAF8_OPHP1|nr:shugoshin family protein [Ophiostoma piceae UAMH 11346]